MVRLEVEQHCNSRSQPMNVLELEARQLAHDPRVVCEDAVKVREGTADVAGHSDRPAGGTEDRAEQLACRGLPVRPRDTDERISQEAGAELDLAPDRDPARPRGRRQRRVSRYAGALDQQLDVFQQTLL